MLESCRLCGGDRLVVWMREGRNRDLLYYKCRDCSLWNYDLDCGTDQTQFTEEYVSASDAGHRYIRHNRRSWEFLKRYVPRPGSIIDIGCGPGGLLYFAREDGWRVRGMELSEDTARTIREEQGIEVDAGNFLELENKGTSQYDVVVLRHVLEHLPDSVLAMRKIGELLKDNGIALLEFPNTRSYSYAMKRFLKNRGLKNKRFPEDWRPGHVNEFCQKTFRILLDKTGFELVVWRTYSNKPVMNMFYRYLPIASKARAIVRKRPATGD